MAADGVARRLLINVTTAATQLQHATVAPTGIIAGDAGHHRRAFADLASLLPPMGAPSTWQPSMLCAGARVSGVLLYPREGFNGVPLVLWRRFDDASATTVCVNLPPSTRSVRVVADDHALLTTKGGGGGMLILRSSLPHVSDGTLAELFGRTSPTLLPTPPHQTLQSASLSTVCVGRAVRAVELFSSSKRSSSDGSRSRVYGYHPYHACSPPALEQANDEVTAAVPESGKGDAAALEAANKDETSSLRRLRNLGSIKLHPVRTTIELLGDEGDDERNGAENAPIATTASRLLVSADLPRILPSALGFTLARVAIGASVRGIILYLGHRYEGQKLILSEARAVHWQRLLLWTRMRLW